MKAGAAAALAIWWTATAAAAAADSRQLTRIQFWSMGTSTRIAIEFSGEFQYKAGRLEKPDRLFFDIGNATFALDGKTRGLHAVAVGDKLVKQIRVANPLAANMTRVVLDLEGEALYTAAELQNPNRLIIEVYPPGQAPAPGDAPSASGDVPVAPARPAAETPAPQRREAASASEPEVGRAPQPAQANSGGDRTLTRALGLKLRRIVIDPGHGGFDVGTMGHDGLKEKDLVLDIGLRLGALIKERLRAEVIYTRDSDQFVALERRPEIANAQHADLFLSIHANSSTVRSVTGVETYYLSVDGTQAALEVAARENATSQKSIADLGDVVQQIALNDRIRESVEFAGRVQYAMVAGTGPPGSRARNRGVRRAPFIVLIGARMPSILAEVGFLSNAQEEAQMQTTEYRDSIAEAVYAGIEAYAQSLSTVQTASAANNKPQPQVSTPATGTGAKPAARPARGRAVHVSMKPVIVATPSAVAVRRGNGPKPSPARRQRSGVSN